MTINASQCFAKLRLRQTHEVQYLSVIRNHSNDPETATKTSESLTTHLSVLGLTVVKVLRRPPGLPAIETRLVNTI